MRGRGRAENWLQHKSLHAFTHARSRSGGGAGAKTASQEMGPTPNLPRPLRNRALQTIIVLKKWQIRPRPHRVCVNIPAVAEREYQNPPATTPRMCEQCFMHIYICIITSHKNNGCDYLSMPLIVRSSESLSFVGSFCCFK